MANHELKIWPMFFDEVLSGRKRFEIRFNDRDYKVGDTLVLKEWCHEADYYTGRVLAMRVTYISDYKPGLREGFVVMGIEPWKNYLIGVDLARGEDIIVKPGEFTYIEGADCKKYFDSIISKDLVKKQEQSHE